MDSVSAASASSCDTLGQMRKRVRSMSVSSSKDCSPEKRLKGSDAAAVIRSMNKLVRERRQHGQHQLVGRALVLAEVEAPKFF